MTRRGRRFRVDQIVVSAEHADRRVPTHLGRLGLPQRVLDSHHSWDPGAAIVARALAAAFGAPLHLGRHSRLVVDLNRSHSHPRVVAPTLRPGERPVPANHGLGRVERADRLERYWAPWRDAVETDLDAAVEQRGLAFHISVHSFVERLGGDERRNHFGLLYGSSHAIERPLADRLHARLATGGYHVRRNYPYSGRDDGFCMRMRAERPERRYVGMEIEMNQRWVRRPAGARRFASALVAAFSPEFVDAEPSTARGDDGEEWRPPRAPR